MKVGPYVAFTFLCFAFGTSYVVVSMSLGYVDANLLNCMRMWFACGFAFAALIGKMTLYGKSGMWSHINGRKIAMIMFFGTLNYGFPHSLITIAQRSVPSVTVTMSQPCVSMFALIASHFLVPDERFSPKRGIPHVFALVGAILTSMPTLNKSDDWKSTPMVDYGLVALAVASFGFGTVSLKAFLSRVDDVVCVAFQLLGSAIYSTIFGAYQIGGESLMMGMRNARDSTIGWSLCLGFVYTFLTSLMFVYVVKELGPVKAGFANFGQIVVGVFTGVVFLDEWNGYSERDVVVSITGIVSLGISICLGFVLGKKRNRNILASV